MRSRLARRAAAWLLALALVTSCRGGDAPEGTSIPEDTTLYADPPTSDTASPGDTPRADTISPGETVPSDTSAWTAGIVDLERSPSEVALLIAVRAASHEGFDRVVFEFAGSERPGIHVEYVDRPVRDCGAGNVIPIVGDGWLAVRFYPTNAHDESGSPTAGERERSPRLPIVLEIERTCDFEAVVEHVLGVTVPNPYRVIELANPYRVVIDVRHHR